MKSITPTIPASTRITQGKAAAGRAVFPFLPRAGLNLAINAMVAPRFRAACQNRDWMTRRNWFWVAALLSACSRSAPPPDLFPPTVATVWRRTALRSLQPSEAPDPVPRTVINWLQSASYEGPGKLEARTYGVVSPGVALELVQRWRPSADTVFFYRDRFFVVIKWQDADRKALQAFVRELQMRLGKPTETEGPSKPT